MHSSRSYLPSWSDVGRVIAIAALYYGGAHVGYAAAFVNAPVNPIWPPSGISLALLLIAGARYWPGVAIGAFFANQINVPWDTALFVSIGSTLQAVAGVWLLRRVNGFDPKLGRQIDVFSLLVIGCAIGPAIAATWGAAGLIRGGILPGNAFGTIWFTWWIGDAIGVLAVTPLILAWKYARSVPRDRSWFFVVEGAVLLTLPFMVEFSLHKTFDHPHFFFPFVIWSALRFRVLGAANASFMLAAISIGVVRTQPMLADSGGVNAVLINLIGLLSATGATGLILAAIVTERDASEQRLRNSRDELEGQVADRTARLFEMNARLQRELSDRTAEQIENRRRARIFDQAEWGIVVTSIEGARIEMMNDAYARMHGYTHNEMESMDVAMLYAPGEREEFPRHLAEIRQLGHHTYETMHVRKDGSVFPVLVDASVDRDDHGNATHYLVYVQDISERKRREQELSQMEERYRILARNLPNSAVFLIDRELRFVLAEGPELGRTGVSKDLMEGKTLREVFPPEFVAQIEPNINAVLRGESSSAEMPFGAHIYQYTYAPLRSGSGSIEYGMIVAQDITERKRVEEVLEESERRFRDILGNVRLFSLMLDQEGNVTFMNEYALTVMGCSADEVIGLNWFERFVPDPAIAEAFREAFRSGELPTHFENEIVTKQGERRLIRWNNTMLRDPYGTLMGTASIGEDITERKRAEEEQEINQARTVSLLAIMQQQALSIQQWLDFALDEAIKLTQSKIGYVYFYNEEQQQFVLNSWSKDVMAECRIQNPQTCYELDKTGIWGEAVRQRQPIILNDYAATHPLKKGYPEGHAPLRKFLTIPVFAGERIVAVVGVANKESDYTDGDVTQLSLLMNSVWKEAERKRAQEQLLVEKQFTERLVDSLPGLFFVFDAELRLRRWNRHMETVTGFTADELQGRPLVNWHPDARGREVLTNLGRDVFAGSVLVELEAEIEVKGGGVLPVALSAIKLETPEGEMMVGLGLDISDRVKTASALRESEERFRSLFELANDAILVMRDSVFVQCNPQALKIFRCRREDIIGKTPADFSPPTQPDGSISRDASLERIMAAASGTPQRFEWIHTRSDGTPFFTDVSLNQVYLGRDLHVQAVVRDISRRKQAEEEMRRTNQLLTDVLSSSSEVSIIATDPDGIITVFNRGAERMLGYRAEEMVGRRTPESIHVGMEMLSRGRELADRFGEPVAGCDVFFRVARIEGSESREWNYLRKNGTSFPASVVVTPMRSANGMVMGYLSIAQDITERKNAEHELRQKKEELDRFFGVAIDLFCIADSDGKFLRLNQQWHHTLGFEIEEMIGMPFMNLVHPDDVPATVEVTKELSGGKDVMNFVNRYRRIDGHYRWLEWRSASLNGIIYAAARDITEQRYAQLELEFHAEELQRTSKELDQFFNVSADLLCITDLHGRFHRLNRQWSRVLGYSLHELQEKSLRELVVPEDRTAFDSSMKQLRSAGEVLNFVCRFHTRAQEARWLEWHSVLVEDFVYAGARDITERIEAERALAERADELVRSNQELEQFAYVASHDLQEPLRMISSYTQLLSKRYKGKLDADADEFIQYAVGGAVRMQALIKSLLTYSRVTRDRTPAEPVNLEEVLSDVRSNLKVAFEESQAQMTSDTLPTVRGNRMQLIQVFQNLIGNALKFRGDRAPSIHVGARQREDGWEFTVQDNGIGIDQQFFDRIFVIFQRLHTNQEYEGTGIGLAVCKKIIEQHGGRISIVSEQGKGTTFMFTISDGEQKQ